jgi:hypothetical protein
VLSLLLLLACAGCAVGDGVAQAVKWTGKEFGDKPVEPAAPAASRAPAEPDAPPAPASAPRDDIKVESLPPQAQDR